MIQHVLFALLITSALGMPKAKPNPQPKAKPSAKAKPSPKASWQWIDDGPSNRAMMAPDYMEEYRAQMEAAAGAGQN